MRTRKPVAQAMPRPRSRASRRWALLGLLWLPLPALAAFEDLGAGARAPGMGNAFVAVADDIYTVYYNPAGLGTLGRPQFGASYSKLSLGLSDNSNLSTSFIGYAQPLAEGRHGTLAAAWNAFTLDNSVYYEHTAYLSYGRLFLSHPDRGELHAGVSLKYLRRGFGSFPETSNATLADDIAKTGRPDPVLSGQRSRGAFDADLGLLYHLGKHYAAGLAATHVLQPNVAFSADDTDRLPMGFKLGFDYRSLVSNLVAQFDAARSPNGSQDRTFTVAAERWFPRMFLGDFGARCGLAAGSRDYKQVSLGVSYRTRRLVVDYGFGIPIGTVAGTAGSHRFALSFRFGRSSDEEESLEMVLEAMRQLKMAPLVVPRVQGKSLSATQKATVEEYLVHTRALEAAARYREALDKFNLALTVAPADPELIAQYGRLNLVGQQIKALPDYKTDPMQAALHEGVLAFLAGRDLEAVQKVSEALALKPDERDLDVFLSQLELVTGLKRMKVITPRGRDYALAGLLTRANSAIVDRRYDEAAALSLEMLRADPNSGAAWQNLGTAYLALGDPASSLKAWKRAYELERSPALRSAIQGYIKSISRLQARRSAASETKPLPDRPHLAPAERQRLFNAGVDHFTRREFPQAQKVFETILQSDPDDIEAKNALRRVKEELP